jgi:acetyl-CoA synthetase
MSFNIKSTSDYQEQENKAMSNPQSFWASIAKNFSWVREWDSVLNFNFKTPKVDWFIGGKLNITTNCLDRHLTQKAGEVAIVWEANEIDQAGQTLTYKQLYEEVNQFANLLINNGVKAGDRVLIYMPMIPEAIIVMLSSARIGAIHCVVSAGFSSEALSGIIKDSGAKIMITADYLYRGNKKLKLFEIANQAAEQNITIKNVVVYKRTGEELKSAKNILVWQDEIKKYNKECKPSTMNSGDPLFILYASGSTGKPKGIVHSTSGYMVYAAYSFANVFDYQDNDLFFCAADVGWVTGHPYLVYGPLLNGGKILMFEGLSIHATPSRFCKIIEKHKVNIFYTAPMAIRALIKEGDKFVEGFDLSSLKTLGAVGESISEEAWDWYYQKIGNGKCSIVDTWWQTETGGIMISSLAGKAKSNPSFAGKPLPGIMPILLDDCGKEITKNNVVGNLCIKFPWPGIFKTIWGDHKKYSDVYFKPFPGYYFSGDGALKDVDGNFRIIGRFDDVINSSGHRLGTAEIENVINMHILVSESAIIGFPHQIKGEGICAFVIVKKSDTKIADEILQLVEKQISAIAKPDKIYIVSDLPKTRSGKIMKRILKQLIIGSEDFGDVSTLANPDVVTKLQAIIL